MRGNLLAYVGTAEEVLDHVKALVDGLGVAQRELEPAAQQTRAHRSAGAVDDAEEALSVGVERVEELEVAYGEAVEPHRARLVDTADGGDVARACVLGEVEIVEDGAGGDDGMGHAVDAEALERRRAELLAQTLVGGVGGEHPLLHLEVEILLRKALCGLLAASPHDQKLFRSHAAEGLVDVVDRTFGSEELAGGDVQERHAAGRLAEVDGGQEVVLAAREHVVVHGHAGSDKLGDAALDEFLCELWVLKLLADSHALAGAHELGQIAVEGVVGESGELHILRGTVGTTRERYAENLGSGYSVVGESLVKVTDPEEQDGIGMLGLHLDVLLHQRRFDNLLGHGSTYGYRLPLGQVLPHARGWLSR